MVKSQQIEIRVCMDIGSEKHYVGIGLSTGDRIDGFEMSHTPEGIKAFFARLEELENEYQAPIVVAMEACNGYARPIDQMVLAKGYKLLNVNNHKLALFKEVFSGAAKSDPIDAWKIFELTSLKESLPLAKNALHEVSQISKTNLELKRYTRRRQVLVNEKVRILNRVKGDLLAVCPGLPDITCSIGNLWFLRFLTARKDLQQLAKSSAPKWPEEYSLGISPRIVFPSGVTYTFSLKVISMA